jgi:hypothetical protein
MRLIIALLLVLSGCSGACHEKPTGLSATAPGAWVRSCGWEDKKGCCSETDPRLCKCAQTCECWQHHTGKVNPRIEPLAPEKKDSNP